MAKKKAVDRGKSYTYASPEIPNINYADFVRLAPSVHGILFSFGQSHPDRDKHNITYEVIVPLNVCATLHQILDEQLKVLQRLVEETEPRAAPRTRKKNQ